MTVDLAQAIPLLSGLTLILGGIAGAYLGLKSWITKQARPSVQAYEQVAPNGGSQDSTRHLIEQTADDVGELKVTARTNRDIAIRAEAKADSALGLIQQHSIGHPMAGTERASDHD